MAATPQDFDAIVVGAGFGGLGAALRLKELGAKVLLLERVNYPGGCAGSFEKGNARFDAGATLSSGLSEGMLFERYRERFGLDYSLEWMDVLMELRSAHTRLQTPNNKGALVEEFCRLDEDRAPGVRKFFEIQQAVADGLWPLLEQPRALPPFGLRSAMPLAKAASNMVPAGRWMTQSLHDVVRKSGAGGHRALELWLDAICQITVQCSVKDAEAPVALSAMDYPWRGTAHVKGGVGELAWALWRGFLAAGGDGRLSDRAKSIAKEGDRWVVQTRSGHARAPYVALNLLPQDAAKLFATGDRPKTAEAMTGGWGAVMLYAIAEEVEANAPAKHLQLVDDDQAPLVEGNHVFASIASADEKRSPNGTRAVTFSTHVDADALMRLSAEQQALKVEAIQTRMRDVIQKRAPEWAQFRNVFPASPRTFARFVGREGGRVGGPPRRAGLANYFGVRNHRLGKGVFLVGDSVLLGQSTYACAQGGVRVADEIRAAAGAFAPERLAS